MPAVAPSPHTPLPVAPDEADPATFAARADAFAAAQQLFGQQMGAYADNAFQNANIALGAAAGNLNASALYATSTTSLTIGANASRSLSFAETSRQFNKCQWVVVGYATDPTQQMLGIITAVDNTAKTMTIFVPTGCSRGTGTFANWQIAISGPPGADGSTLDRVCSVNTQAGSYTVAAGDLADLIEYTGAGGHTLSLPAAGANTDFNVSVRNAGTGVLIIDPNASELIDGKTTIWVYPNESFSIVCNGTNWRTIGRAKRVLALEINLAGVTTATFETMFGDPEIVRTSFEFLDLYNTSGGIGIQVQIKNNGNYLTSGYGTLDDAGTFSNNNYMASANASYRFHANVLTTPVNVSGYWAMYVQQMGQFPYSNTWTRMTVFYSGTLTGPVQGIKFINGAILTAGKIRCYLERE